MARPPFSSFTSSFTFVCSDGLQDQKTELYQADPLGFPGAEGDGAVRGETVRELNCERLAGVQLPKLETVTLTKSRSLLLTSLYEMKIIPTCLTR